MKALYLICAITQLILSLHSVEGGDLIGSLIAGSSGAWFLHCYLENNN